MTPMVTLRDLAHVELIKYKLRIQMPWNVSLQPTHKSWVVSQWINTNEYILYDFIFWWQTCILTTTTPHPLPTNPTATHHHHPCDDHETNLVKKYAPFFYKYHKIRLKIRNLDM